MDAPEKNLENIQTYIDFVKTNLEPLAEQLKVGVDFLWGILVKQAQVEAIVHLVIAASFFVTTAILFRIFFVHFKKGSFGGEFTSDKRVVKHKKTGKEIRSILNDWEHRDDYVEIVIPAVKTDRDGVVAIISGSLCGLMLLTSVIATSSSLPIIVTGLVNPEYRAIEKIIDFAKPAAQKATTKSEAGAK